MRKFLCTVNTTYTAAYSKKRLPILSFLAECFCILRSLSDLLFVNIVFSFLFRSSFDGFYSTAKETGDPIDTDRLTKLCHASPAVVVESAAVTVAAISSVDWSIT